MNTIDDNYRRLARHLDDMPGGFPATASGVELRILRRLFDAREAELALHVGLIPVEAAVIARRANIGRREAESRLEAMARKGLIVRLDAKTVQYVGAQFVIGIWELHLNDLSPELIRDFEEYLPFLFPEAWKVPQMRTIPVNESLPASLAILPHEHAVEIVSTATRLAVAQCICRRERHMVGKGCSKLGEACLVFDAGADLFQRNGLARPISHSEALEILARADKEGLVLQPGNWRKANNICCCCGCCCGVLRSLKAYPKPAALASSPFFATTDAALCEGCELCLTRCPMSAIRLDSGKAAVNHDRCIGCGLCVSTCPTGCLTLARKPESAQPPLPENGMDAMIQLGRARGKCGTADLAWQVLKSKMERLLAATAKP